MSELALRLIEENKRTKDTFLDLGNCGLRNELPKELAECVWLKHLSLGAFYFGKEEKTRIKSKNNLSVNLFSGKELNFLQNLTGLQSLYFHSNQISEISFLANLSGLKSLDLSENRISNISSLANLTQLKNLHIHSNQISNINSLASLTDLKSLDLSKNQIEDYNFLTNLTDLQSLSLSLNQIEDYSFLANLINLQGLDLRRNKILDTHFLGNLTRLQSLDLSYNQIQDISFLQNLTQLQSLDLSNNQIEDYSFLQNLTQLQSLNLRSNQIEDYSFLQNLTQLQSLYLSNNQIEDINFLKNLTQLQSLDLSINQIKDCSFSQNLTQLQSLDLSHNQIHDISFLQNFTQLQSLDLSNNQIQNYSFLQNLTQLYSLELHSNKIQYISFLQNLTQLQSLNLSYNQIQYISFLQDLTQLQSLDLSNNQIEDYSFLQNLTQLQSLDLSNNQIQDYSFLQNLTQLQSLDLSNNQIQDIGFLQNLPQLQSLDLRYNQIQDIKSLLPLLKNGLEVNLEEYGMIGILLYNNPINTPPIEIQKQGRKAIIEYFEGLRKPLNECKLIFVGEGGVGKTSLMRRIVDGKFDANEKTTHGINKIAWKDIKNEKQEEIKVNLWDFGGQHIQHSLHQFFFTERVIYVLVLDPRNDSKANYWLDQIEKLGCNSEILIAYNWKQQEDKQADFLSNFYELRKKYPKLPEPFLLSCLTGDGVVPFKEAVIKSILNSEDLNTEYLVSWFNIKQRLEKEVSVGKNYITYETYQEWCDKEDYIEPERQKSLLRILDSIGSIVFFDKPILNQLQVLNPEWLTTGAYAILVSEQNRFNKGHLSWKDLKEIFKEPKEIFSDKTIKIKYTESQFSFIIELMIQYDLCHRKPSPANEFLIPSAFGDKPDKDYSFAKENAQWYRLQFESPFEMLIMHRFITKNLSKIIGKDYWQSGIYIKHPNSETYALIETNLYSKRIDCWIKGYNVRGFWEMIRGDFREILSIYNNFIYKEEVLYKKDGREVFLPYDEMLNCLKNGIKLIPYHPSYQLANIDVLAVLDLFEDKNQTNRIMENEKGINTTISPIINVNPNIETKIVNSNTVNQKVAISDSKELAEIKELLLELEDYEVKNEEWKNILIKSLDEFHRLEMAEEKAAQKASVSRIDKYFKKLKDITDVINIALLPVDVVEKTPKLLDIWNALKKVFD